MSVAYGLDIAFSAADLRQLVSNEYKVVISKGSVIIPNSQPLPVVWIAFDPFQSNEVDWSEQYDWYVSNTEVQDGAVIEQLSTTTTGVQANVAYAFNEGTFSSNGTQLPVPNGFSIQNKSGEQYVFGLCRLARQMGRCHNHQLWEPMCLTGIAVHFTQLRPYLCLCCKTQFKAPVQ